VLSYLIKKERGGGFYWCLKNLHPAEIPLGFAIL